MPMQDAKHNRNEAIGTKGYQGVRYASLSTEFPSRRYCLRNINCEALMLIHTTTTASPDMDTSAIYTVPGATILESSASPPPIILRMTAFSGTPCFDNFANKGEMVFLSASDHSIRDDAYNPEFAADKIAVKITKFITSAAYGTPTRSITVTKGLSVTPASDIGSKADSTIIVPMKKITRRNSVVRIAFGIVFSGLTDSPAAIPISSVRRRRNSPPASSIKSQRLHLETNLRS